MHSSTGVNLRQWPETFYNLHSNQVLCSVLLWPLCRDLCGLSLDLFGQKVGLCPFDVAAFLNRNDNDGCNEDCYLYLQVELGDAAQLGGGVTWYSSVEQAKITFLNHHTPFLLWLDLTFNEDRVLLKFETLNC